MPSAKARGRAACPASTPLFPSQGLHSRGPTPPGKEVPGALRRLYVHPSLTGGLLGAGPSLTVRTPRIGPSTCRGSGGLGVGACAGGGGWAGTRRGAQKAGRGQGGDGVVGGSLFKRQ